MSFLGTIESKETWVSHVNWFDAILTTTKKRDWNV